MNIKVIPPNSLKAFRYRVHCLEQDLWKEKNPICRANLAVKLADAAKNLAKLEMQEANSLPQVVHQVSSSTD